MQIHELDVDVRGGLLSPADCAQIATDFVEKYERTYGQNSAYTAAGIDCVTLRIVGTVKLERPSLEGAPASMEESSFIDTRKAFFSPGGFIDTQIHVGDKIRPGQILDGPAIVRRRADTVVLPPGSRASADAFGGLTVTHQHETHA
jgi:N-methylhydantoinase A